MDRSELQTILTDIGLDITRSTPQEVWAHCPDTDKHERGDRNASWSINVDTGAHNCFSCGFRGSLRSLIEFTTGEVPRDLDDTIKRATVRRRLAGAAAKISGSVVKEEEPEVFISEFQLATYGKVPRWACDERQLDPDEVDFYGVRWDHENERYIIPIRDMDGKLLGWQAKGHKYFRNVPKEMHKSGSLFGLDVFRGPRAILVESPLDAVRLASVGITGGLASYGAHVSDEQMQILKLSVARRVVLALDHDTAGRDSMLRLIDEYRKEIELWIVRYRPDDPKDIGEMKKAGDIYRLIRRAVRVGERRVHR
jgi:hypothetical protein